MTMQKKYIEDENGNKVLPITHFSAVKNSSGDTLDDVLYTESTYDPTTYSGMGRKVLQKNMVNGVNTLTQDMMPVATGGNTIYIIRYDFTLGEDITVPANCVLEFDGGSISGAYTLSGNNTGIVWNNKNAIFGNGVLINGSWVVPYISSKMFSNLNYNNSLRTVMALNNPNIQTTVVVEKESYNYPIVLSTEYESGIVIASNTDFVLNGTIEMAGSNLTNYAIIRLYDSINVSIKGSGTIIGDRDNHTGSTGEWGHCISLWETSGIIKNVTIEGLTLKKAWGDGIYVLVDSEVTIRNCEIFDCRRQGISITNGERGVIENCYIHDIAGTSPQACIDFEPNSGSSASRWIVRNCVIVNDFPNNRQCLNIIGSGNHDIIVEKCHLEGQIVVIGVSDSIRTADIYFNNNKIVGSIRTWNIDITHNVSDTVFFNRNVIEINGDGYGLSVKTETFKDNVINITNTEIYGGRFYNNIINYTPYSNNFMVLRGPQGIIDIPFKYVGNQINILTPPAGSPAQRNFALIQCGFAKLEEFRDNIITTEYGEIFGVISDSSAPSDVSSNNFSIYINSRNRYKNSTYYVGANRDLKIQLGDNNLIHGTYASLNSIVSVLTKGFCAFDDTNNKPIFYTGSGWVDGAGNAVQ